MKIIISSQSALESAIDTFLRIGMLGRSEKTVSWYAKRLYPMADIVGRTIPIGQIDDGRLLEWYADLERKKSKWGKNSTHPQENGPYSKAYLYSMIRAIRYFFRWLHKDAGALDKNPAACLALPELPETGRKGIADSDVHKILNIAMQGESGMKIRDYAILRFLECTGCRLGGVVGLLLGDLNMDSKKTDIRRRVTVTEKFEETRTVFLTPGALEALEAWLKVRPEIEDNHVFLGYTARLKWHALTENGIYEIVERYAGAAGVTQNWSPHQWRHRFGRKLAERGMNLGQISQIMGHKDVGITVSYYGIFSVAELHSSYDRFYTEDL